MNRAKNGLAEEIRTLPPVAALEEAVGRSVEMGRPVMMTYGMASTVTSDVVIGLSALNHVAKLTAEKGGNLLIGVGGPQTFPMAMENYRIANIEAGTPEAFNPDNVYFYTNQQWAYASGVMGLMERERPAASIFMGLFLVEGIHFGITSQRIDTMAIAGNPSLTMAAFMFVSMDYVLFGEELYAAGADFTKEPVKLNTLAAEDVIKWGLIALTLIGSLFVAFGSTIISDLMVI
jgi:hypothetical protein